MEEIDLKELLEYFKNKIGLFIMITVGVCLVGCLYGLFLQTPMYQSYTTVILGGTEGSTSNTITQNDLTLSKNLVDTYTEIVKSRRVLSQVIADLNMDVTYEKLSSKISVAAVTDTIIKITVNDKDAIKAKNIANITANYFSEEVEDLYNMNNVNILDEAIQAEKPYNINVVKQAIIYIILGVLLATAILFLYFYFDRTIKTTEQIEQKIKLPILGSVQEINRGGKK